MAVKSAKQKGYSAPIIFARKVQEKIPCPPNSAPQKASKRSNPPPRNPVMAHA
jgi:hypothetical protein